jgi:hypothetical protein
MKGSGYVKESTGTNELSTKMNELISQREAQITAIFSPSQNTMSKNMSIAIYSLAFDKYVTEKIKQPLNYKSEIHPDYEHMYETVTTYLNSVGVEDIHYVNPPRRTTTYLDVGQIATSRWGVCAVHVFIGL